MKTFRNSKSRNNPDYFVKFLITELVICAVLLTASFIIYKLLPESFEHLRNSFNNYTENGYSIPEIGNILTRAAKQVMEYLGVVPHGEV